LAVIFGNLRKLAASVSIAVETARPVTGHLIITKLMGVMPSEFEATCARLRWNSEIVTDLRRQLTLWINFK